MKFSGPSSTEILNEVGAIIARAMNDEQLPEDKAFLDRLPLRPISREQGSTSVVVGLEVTKLTVK